MEVYIFRHARSDFRSEGEDPPISEQGRSETERVVELANKRFGFKPTALVCSPLLRAKQTADLARKRMGLKPAVVNGCLYGDAEPGEVLKFLSKYKKEDKVALVSHMPLVFELLYSFVGGRGEVELFNGSIAAISFKGKAAEGRGKLLWLIQPGV
ncbi:MAG: histidine phosphatase family protein [Nitrososphaerota archaeon]|jgi:phosphohistidine phosphatase SixA|nr:histidine phosphatase family protein [Nitrososphaerota archaeon]MDG6919416.1 histidine phosphatase family protein [Nitrososphaerota archaeon]